jgi:hypothetical protein
MTYRLSKHQADPRRYQFLVPMGALRAESGGTAVTVPRDAECSPPYGRLQQPLPRMSGAGALLAERRAG